MAAETSQTLDRGIRVLMVLAAAPQGLTVTALAEALGINRTVVYRLVSTLEQHSLVRRDGQGRLHVGLGVLHLATAVQPVLRDVAIPVLRQLAERVGCTAHLTVAEGDEALALAVIEPSWTDFHVATGSAPATRSPGEPPGKAILALRDPDGPPYVATAGELEPGARGLAAPVRGVGGLEASVGVVTLVDWTWPRSVPLVAEAADRLAERLR